MSDKEQDDVGKLKKTKGKRSKRSKQWKYTRHSCWQSLTRIQLEIQSIDTAQFKKENTSKCSTFDGWLWISLPQPNNQRNDFPQFPTERGTKWLCQTGNFWMRCWAWHQIDVSSALEFPNSLIITNEVLTADKMQQSQFRKKVVSCWPEIMVHPQIKKNAT